MKRIEITPVCGLTKHIVDALEGSGFGSFVLSDVVNMMRDHMIPRYGDWDRPPPNDYRTKIEIIASDEETNQIIETIQEVSKRVDYIPPNREHGNIIFISSVEKVFSIETGKIWHGSV